MTTGRAEGALGTTTEFSSAASKSVLVRRYNLQSEARRLLPDNNRLSACHRLLAPGAGRVRVQYQPERNSARYGNLCLCNSSWTCPVCAVAITERRRYELHQAVDRASEIGLEPVHLIFTMQHHRGQRLRDLLKQLIGAFNAVNSGRGRAAIWDGFGFVGFVRSLEITEGSKAHDNGWHPHLHVLAFADAALVNSPDYHERLRVALWKRWEAALKSRGGAALQDYGLKVVQGSSYTAEYIAKFGHEPRERTWSAEQELAKSNVKIAREDGRTPFALLEDSREGDELAGQLFKEYAAAVKGRSQLHWSKGLKELLGVEVLSDEDAVKDGSFSDRLLLERDTWSVIARREKRGEVLDYVISVQGDAVAAARWINDLTGTRGATPVLESIFGADYGQNSDNDTPQEISKSANQQGVTPAIVTLPSMPAAESVTADCPTCAPNIVTLHRNDNGRVAASGSLPVGRCLPNVTPAPDKSVTKLKPRWWQRDGSGDHYRRVLSPFELSKLLPDQLIAYEAWLSRRVVQEGQI